MFCGPRKEEEGPRKIGPFLEANRLIPVGGGPEKPDSDFACLRPFSRLGNAHAESARRPSESIGGDREFCPVLEPNCLISGV